MCYSLLGLRVYIYRTVSLFNEMLIYNSSHEFIAYKFQIKSGAKKLETEINSLCLMYRNELSWAAYV